MGMLFNPATNGGDFIIVQPGVYTVEFSDIKLTSHPEYGPGYNWRFLIDTEKHPDAVTDEGEPLMLSGLSGTKMSKKAKARLWIEALLGRELAEGEAPSEDDIRGKKVQAMVSILIKDGKEYNKIDSLAPIPTGSVRRPTAAAAAGKF